MIAWLRTIVPVTRSARVYADPHAVPGRALQISTPYVPAWLPCVYPPVEEKRRPPGTLTDSIAYRPFQILSMSWRILLPGSGQQHTNGRRKRGSSRHRRAPACRRSRSGCTIAPRALLIGFPKVPARITEILTFSLLLNRRRFRDRNPPLCTWDGFRPNGLVFQMVRRYATIREADGCSYYVRKVGARRGRQ